MRHLYRSATLVTLALQGIAHAQGVPIDFGVGDSLALDQPRLLVNLLSPQGQPFGSSGYTMIADTGASGYLLAQGAHQDFDILGGNFGTISYPSAGPYLEQGVGGLQPVDITQPMTVRIARRYDGLLDFEPTAIPTFDRTPVQAIAAPDLALGSFDGIVGMPGMQGKFIRANLANITRTITGNDVGLGGLLDSANTIDFIGVEVLDAPPTAPPLGVVHPFTFSQFPIDPAMGRIGADGPMPTSANLPILGGINVAKGAASQNNLGMLFDTGAQLSMISSKVATDLGIDLSDPNLEYLEVGGVGGTTEIPIVQIDRFELQTDEGNTLIFHNLVVGVIDIEGLPVDGIMGFNLFTTGYLAPILAALGDTSTGADATDDGALLDLLLDFTGDTWKMQMVANPLYDPNALPPDFYTDELSDTTGLAAPAIPGLGQVPGIDGLGTGVGSYALFAWPALQVPEPRTLPLVILLAAGLSLAGRPWHGPRG